MYEIKLNKRICSKCQEVFQPTSTRQKLCKRCRVIEDQLQGLPVKNDEQGLFHVKKTGKRRELKEIEKRAQEVKARGAHRAEMLKKASEAGMSYGKYVAEQYKKSIGEL